MVVMTRRQVLRGGLAVAALGATGSWTSSASAAGSSPFVAYSADSFFKSRLTGAPVDSALTSSFRSFVKNHPDQRGYMYPRINGFGTNLWGTAFALGTASDPVWRLVGSGVLPSVCADLKTTGFHAPAWFGSMFSGTNDSPFVCVDTGFGQSIWAANAAKGSGNTISFSAAGRFKHNTNGLDRRNPRSNGPKNERSRGAIPDAMAIRRDLLDRAIANQTGLGHVLHMFFVETSGPAGFCHPMVNGESKHSGWGAEGVRIAVAPNVDLTRRGLSPAALAVARTLQQHGCYLGDNSGSQSALKAEQTSSARNPWAGLSVSRDMLKGITWDDFVVISKGWQ